MSLKNTLGNLVSLNGLWIQAPTNRVGRGGRGGRGRGRGASERIKRAYLRSDKLIYLLSVDRQPRIYSLLPRSNCINDIISAATEIGLLA